MTVLTFEVLGGEPTLATEHLTLAAVIERRAALQQRLAEIRDAAAASGLPPFRRHDGKDFPRMTREQQYERQQIVSEIALLERRSKELKEQEKLDKQRRVFAGIGSPFHEAVCDLLGDDSETALSRLETRAMGILAERERRNVERRVAKEAARTESQTK